MTSDSENQAVLPAEGASSASRPSAGVGRAWPQWLAWLCYGVLCLSVLGPLPFAGLWDPPELSGAEFSRRIAVNVLGGRALAIEGANNELPTVEEVGRGELPFFVVASGFRVFGLHDWAGRLPLGVCALLGALALFYALQRLVGRKPAGLSMLVLASMPLFFGQARTLLGDALTAACSALAFAALLLCSFDPRLRLPLRSGWLVVGLGAMGLGILTRGVLLAVAVPALSVGLAWTLTGPSLRSEGKRVSAGAVCGLSCLLVGLVGLGWGVAAALGAGADEYLRALGSSVEPPRRIPTHDFILGHLGHALFPWSAFVPVAVGLLLARDAHAGAARDAATVDCVKAALLFASVLAVAAHTLIAPRVGLVPYSAPYALAGLAAFGLLELDRRRLGAPVVAICCAAFVIVLFSDFRYFPEKGLSPFGLPKPTLPEEFENPTKLAFALSGVPVVLVMALLALERWPGLRTLSAWATRARPWRSSIVLGAFVAPGLALSLGYYPALAAQLSPKGLFETFTDLRAPGEPLATTGKGGKTSAYYGARDQRHFENDREAMNWLLETETERRWLVVKSSDLPKVTSRYRQTFARRTLPVLDTSSGDVLLVSNLLRPGETNQNPLARFLPEAEPTPKHPVQAAFGEQLRAIGWEMRDPKTGEVVNALVRGRHYRVHLYYEVLGRITQNWKTFVHLDGNATRVNADHDTLEDQYACRFWNKGDFIHDQHEFELEPDFAPGQYRVFFGFYSGKTRMDVTQGGDKDDRVDGGTIAVQ